MAQVYIRLGASHDDDMEVIHLNKGHPTPRLLPVDEIRSVITQMADERARTALMYNPGGGHDALRIALARFLSHGYRFPVTPEELLASNGASMSLSMACRVFARDGDTVVCSDPTYFLARDVFTTARLQVRGIPCDQRGLRVDLLESALATGELRPTLVYCIPSFHNPTGVELAPERAERLVALAERHDFIILADEPYSLLHFDDRPPPCLMSYDRGRGRVFSLGSFTKILAPGLRAGWVHAHPSLLARFRAHGALISGGGLSPLPWAIVHETIESGFLARNIESLRAVYGERARATADALRTHLPECHFHAPRGGYFMWLDLGAACQSARLHAEARAHGVEVTPGARCAVDGGHDQFARICFARYETEELCLGIERLARAVRAARA